MRLEDIRQSLYNVTPFEMIGPNWRDLVIERRELAFQRGYTGYPGEEEYAIAYVINWFVLFYERFASHIVYAEAYDMPFSFGFVYGIRLMIKGTRAEMAEIEKAVKDLR